jgi:hypothetical protein
MSYKKIIVAALTVLIIAFFVEATLKGLGQTHWMTLIDAPPSVDVPWVPGKQDQMVSVDLEVIRRTYFVLGIDLYFDSHNEESRARVQKLAGHIYTDRDGVIHDTGLSVPIHITIMQTDGSAKKSIFDSVIENQTMVGYSANAFSRKIMGLPLEPGKYQISATALADFPELSDAVAHFYVRSPGNLK